jgi:hypothetical protein
MSLPLDSETAQKEKIIQILFDAVEPISTPTIISKLGLDAKRLSAYFFVRNVLYGLYNTGCLEIVSGGAPTLLSGVTAIDEVYQISPLFRLAAICDE